MIGHIDRKEEVCCTYIIYWTLPRFYLIPHGNHQKSHVLCDSPVNAVGERVSRSSSMVFGKNTMAGISKMG